MEQLGVLSADEISGPLIPVDVPDAPQKENEQWSAWIVATEYRDLTPVNESDRMAARYRVRLLE